jgi:ABC-type Fe3+/spermidine/putrescine transport system ATPase subunit
VKRVGDILDLVGLTGFERRMPKQLSGGQQQRVALARALVTGPDLLLLDEPLSSLDANLRQQLQRHLRHLQRALGVTTLMVTHDREEAMGVSSRIVAMSRGRIVQAAPAEELYRSPLSSFVMQFTGDTNLIAGRCKSAGADGIVIETSLGAVTARSGTRASSGAAVRIGLRPEDILVARRGTASASPRHNLCEGRIEDIMFLGAVTTIEVSVGAGTLTARCPTAQAPDARIGDAVDVTVSHNAIHVFDEGEQDDAH